MSPKDEVKKMAHSVISHPQAKAIAHSIMQKMACGGMAGFADGGMVEEEKYSESSDDLFNDDNDAPLMAGGGEVSDQKKRISDIMKSIRMKKA